MPRLLLILAVLFMASPIVGAGGSLAVIVKPDVTDDNLTFEEFRRIYLGDKGYWSSKQRVTLLVRAAPSDERSSLLKSVYQMNEGQFRQYWIAKVFRAEATASPKTVMSAEMAGNLVRGIPGAVAIVKSSEIPKGVKVLKIDGKKPGESGYRFNY